MLRMIVSGKLIEEGPRAVRIAILVMVASALTWSQTAANDSHPAPSATSTEYLSCTIWKGKLPNPPTERSVRTPMLQSPKGSRAYGEVSVAVEGRDCENTTTLNVASSASPEFSMVYKARGANGNGIRLIGWSPSGDKLLAEMNHWDYFTDGGFNYVPLIYDSTANQAIEMKSADEALTQHFGTECDFEPTVEGWKSDTQILIRVSKAPADELNEQKPCVKKPQTFIFDLESGIVVLSKK